MSTWSFKPALLRGAQEWRLDKDVVTGPPGSLDLSRVTKAAFVEQTLRGHRFTRLDLAGDGERLSIAITSSIASGPGDPDRAQHLALLSAVADRLAELHPQLPVTIGEYGRAALAMFWIGIATLLFGVGIAAAALASGVSGDRLGAAAAPILMMIAFGAVVAWTRRPWKPPLTLPAAALPALLTVYSGNRQANAEASAEGE